MKDRTEKIIELIRSDRSTDAPEEAIKWVKNLYRTDFAHAVEPRPLLKRILAALQMDVSLGTALQGERATQGTAVRTLVFTVDELVIQIEVSGHSKRFELIGQILGSSEPNLTVQLKGAGVVKEILTDDGQFQFSITKKGDYSVSVLTDASIIETGTFSI